MVNIAVERLDVENEDHFITEKQLHLSRYKFATKLLRKFLNDDHLIYDVACGTGYGTAMISKSGLNVIGIDVDEEVIVENKRKYREIKEKFKIGSILSLPAADNSINALVCFETIEHISLDDGRLALKEIFRVLKPGGLLLISSPNRFWMKFIHLIKANPHHLHEYFPNELINEGKYAGFKIMKKLSQMPFIPIVYPFANRGIITNKFWFDPQSLNQNLCLYHVSVFEKPVS